MDSSKEIEERRATPFHFLLGADPRRIAQNGNVSRNLIGIVVSLALVPPLHAQVPQDYAVRDTVTDCLNIRAQSDTSVAPFACLPAGTVVNGISSVPYWREVEIPTGETGWAAKKFLEPIPTPPPAPADAPIPADAFLEVHFVDVGQGDAIWITTHDDGVADNGRF